MTPTVQTLTVIKQIGNASYGPTYRVGYDGHILGDSRSFQHEELAQQEIRRILEKDARDAVIYQRPLLYTA